MNTPIIKISDDQNEITHESGVVTVFKKDDSGICFGCFYATRKEHDCRLIPCDYNKIKCKRKDGKSGIFKLKQPTT